MVADWTLRSGRREADSARRSASCCARVSNCASSSLWHRRLDRPLPIMAKQFWPTPAVHVGVTRQEINNRTAKRRKRDVGIATRDERALARWWLNWFEVTAIKGDITRLRVEQRILPERGRQAAANIPRSTLDCRRSAAAFHRRRDQPFYRPDISPRSIDSHFRGNKRLDGSPPVKRELAR